MSWTWVLLVLCLPSVPHRRQILLVVGSLCLVLQIGTVMPEVFLRIGGPPSAFSFLACQHHREDLSPQTQPWTDHALLLPLGTRELLCHSTPVWVLGGTYVLEPQVCSPSLHSCSFSWWQPKSAVYLCLMFGSFPSLRGRKFLLYQLRIWGSRWFCGSPLEKVSSYALPSSHSASFSCVLSNNLCCSSPRAYSFCFTCKKSLSGEVPGVLCQTPHLLVLPSVYMLYL